jgi:exopolysaccharide production protein ExoZ
MILSIRGIMLSILCCTGEGMEKRQTVQILRAGAAMGVVTFHLLQVSASRFGTRASFGLGGWGVDVFFVISGFVIAASGLRVGSPTRFLRQRFARIVPLYWLLTFAVFVVAVVAPSTLRSTVADPVYLVKSLLFIPYRRESGAIEPMLYQGWTLNYEIFFYLVLGLSLASRTLFFLFALFISIVALGIMFAPQSVVLSFYTSSIILEFAYGSALYLMTAGGRRTWTGQWILLPAGLVTLCATFYFLPTWPRCITAGIPAAAIVAGAVVIPNKDWPLLRWAETLGDASYSIYLVHAFMVIAAFILAHKLFGTAHPNLALLCMTVVAFPTTIMSSLALYRFFEKPMNLWLTARPPQLWSTNLSAYNRLKQISRAARFSRAHVE